MLLIPLFLAGLAITSQDGLNRWIYGLLTLGAVAALVHFGQIHVPTHLREVSRHTLHWSRNSTP